MHNRTRSVTPYVEPRTYLYLSDIAKAMARAKGKSRSNRELRDLLRAFWLGEFENLSEENPAGTLMGGDHFKKGRHVNRNWLGMPFGREAMLHDTLGTVAGLPDYGSFAADGDDPHGAEWIRKTKIEREVISDDSTFAELSECPRKAYPKIAQEFMGNLALRPEIVEL